MQPFRSEDIFGNWATTLLHIKEDDAICFASLERDLRYLASVGVNGIYTNGTAGEFNEQSESEFERISELTAEICSENAIPYQIGASHTSALIMLRRIRTATRLGPGAIQVIFPDWFALSDSEAVEFLKKCEEAADGIGLVLYNPPHAKRIFSPREIGHLKSRIPSIVGIKVKSKESAWFDEVRKYCEGISVFVPGHFLASSLALGAAGSYSNIACLNPKGAQQWYELTKTSPTKATELESRIRSYLQEFILPFREKYHYSNAALDKLLAAVGGWGSSGTRLKFPYKGVLDADISHLREAAKAMIPEIMVPI